MWIPISAILQLQADPQISLLLCFLSGPKAEYLCPTCRIVREKRSHMVKSFKLCGKDARDYYSTDVKTESQGSKQACLKSCGKWASGTPLNALDYDQVFWSYCFLRNQGPTEVPYFCFVFFFLRGATLLTLRIVGFLSPAELAFASFWKWNTLPSCLSLPAG